MTDSPIATADLPTSPPRATIADLPLGVVVRYDDTPYLPFAFGTAPHRYACGRHGLMLGGVHALLNVGGTLQASMDDVGFHLCKACVTTLATTHPRTHRTFDPAVDRKVRTAAGVVAAAMKNVWDCLKQVFLPIGRGDTDYDRRLRLLSQTHGGRLPAYLASNTEQTYSIGERYSPAKSVLRFVDKEDDVTVTYLDTRGKQATFPFPVSCWRNGVPPDEP